MTLFAETIEREFPDLHRQGVRVRFVGRRDRCPESLRQLMEDMERARPRTPALDLWVAFDYGARAEIVDAARATRRDGVAADDVDEERSRRTCTRPTCPIPTW